MDVLSMRQLLVTLYGINRYPRCLICKRKLSKLLQHWISHTKQPRSDIDAPDQRVRMEADRVGARFVSQVDTTSEVVQRFDFMTESDTRVSC